MMLRAYAVERLPPLTIVPIAAVLAIAAAAGRTPLQLAADAALALILLVQFRIWDDIEDRERDALDHPSRVLVRAASVRPFRAAAVGLGVVNLTLLAALSLEAAAVYIALVAALAIWYSRRTSRSTAGDCLLLAKYPAFVTVIAAMRPIERPVLLAATVAVTYLSACLYEAWHDASSPLRRIVDRTAFARAPRKPDMGVQS